MESRLKTRNVPSHRCWTQKRRKRLKNFYKKHRSTESQEITSGLCFTLSILGEENSSANTFAAAKNGNGLHHLGTEKGVGIGDSVKMREASSSRVDVSFRSSVSHFTCPLNFMLSDSGTGDPKKRCPFDSSFLEFVFWIQFKEGNIMLPFLLS
ncbi:hypothetical protein V6N12_026350 [Hibiscus sabdariffa]|uniref:Uncharacterized protein n=1 Tax=Hibiscus sabdariffa TaxID=183260 RepID=A0ABR2DRI5_9ROSI